MLDNVGTLDKTFRIIAGIIIIAVTAMCAAALITSIPPLLIILFFQKYIVSGLLAGAVKG